MSKLEPQLVSDCIIGLCVGFIMGMLFIPPGLGKGGIVGALLGAICGALRFYANR